MKKKKRSIVIVGMDSGVAATLEANGATVLKLGDEKYAVSYRKSSITAADFKGTSLFKSLNKRFAKDQQKIKRAIRVKRRNFIKKRKAKLGRNWRNVPLKINKVATSLMFSLLRKNIPFKFDNGYYASRYELIAIERYRGGQAKKIYLRDLESWRSSAFYSFNKIKNFKKLIRKLYKYLRKRGTHGWLIDTAK